MKQQYNIKYILALVVIIGLLYLIYNKNLIEGFWDPTFCYPCSRQSSSDPTYCLSCSNCYWENGVCKPIGEVVPTAAVYGYNPASQYIPWSYSWWPRSFRGWFW